MTVPDKEAGTLKHLAKPRCKLMMTDKPLSEVAVWWK